MARPGITGSEVVAAINSIIAAGGEPTIQGIREHLGTGSPNTIHRHLVAWRESRPIEQRKAPELPAELQAALVREIERQAAEQRAEVEKALVESQKEAATLAKSGEELEDTNSTLEEQNTELAAERERLTALAAERHDEIEDLKSDLERERKAAEEARIETAKARNRMEDQSERLKEYQSLLSDLRSTEKEAYDGKVKAEQAAAVADARLESERVMVAEMNKHLDKLRNQIETSNDKHEKELTELRLQAKSDTDARSKELADSNNKLVTALNQVAAIERELANSKAENQQFKAEIAELKKAPKTRADRAAKDEKKES